MNEVFEQEQCWSCGRDGELVHRTYYTWRCRSCGQSWVRVGGVMDVANRLIDASVPDDDMHSL